MGVEKPVRVLISLAITLLALLIIAAILYLSESAFSVWDRLQEGPRWLFYLYLSSVGAVLAVAAFLVFRTVLPGKPPAKEKPDLDLSEFAGTGRLDDSLAQGMDVEEAQRELEALADRRATGRIYIVLLGDISTGKSSLIKALIPGEDPEISVRGGSTREITQYSWKSPAGDELILVDLPGLHEAGGDLDSVAREEALRAHLAIFVCDADLTSDQQEVLQEVLTLAKPSILALNKMDRYTQDDLSAIKTRLSAHLQGMAGKIPVVAITSGGREPVTEIGPDGETQETERERVADVDELTDAIREQLNADPKTLNALRDVSVFYLVSKKLDESQARYRRGKATELVKSYTRKAVVGALAAISPGTDIVIQGFLGTAMVKNLCELYEVPVRQMEIEKFLDLSQSHVGKTIPILLAVAGNGLKAFPGVGTVAGGLVHAVAYGLIFDALGRSLACTLESRGDLDAQPTIERFKESLSEDLGSRTRALAKLALEVQSDRSSDPR